MLFLTAVEFDKAVRASMRGKSVFVIHKAINPKQKDGTLSPLGQLADPISEKYKEAKAWLVEAKVEALKKAAASPLAQFARLEYWVVG